MQRPRPGQLERLASLALLSATCALGACTKTSDDPPTGGGGPPPADRGGASAATGGAGGGAQGGGASGGADAPGGRTGDASAGGTGGGATGGTRPGGGADVASGAGGTAPDADPPVPDGEVSGGDCPLKPPAGKACPVIGDTCTTPAPGGLTECTCEQMGGFGALVWRCEDTTDAGQVDQMPF